MSSRNPKYIQKYKWTIVSLYYLGKHIKKYARNMEFLPIKLSYTQVVSESVSSFCSQLNVIHISLTYSNCVIFFIDGIYLFSSEYQNATGLPFSISSQHSWAISYLSASSSNGSAVFLGKSPTP